MNRIYVEDIISRLTGDKNKNMIRICMLLSTETSFGEEVYFDFPINEIPIDVSMLEVLSIDNPGYFFTPAPLCLNVLEESYPGGYALFSREYKKYMI